MADPAQADDYGANPIPMTPEQLGLLLDNIAKLDTDRCILEPGVILAETQTLLNLRFVGFSSLSIWETLFGSSIEDDGF